MKPIIIIPSLNPDLTLITLIDQLITTGNKIVVINDGSDTKFKSIFQKINRYPNCHICTHEKNMGKGFAIKTGIQYALSHFPETVGFVTADGDGQHLATDIVKLCNRLEEDNNAMILGTRKFKFGQLPIKSYLGNRITSLVYFITVGRKCPDTQTGLRGIPIKYGQECLKIKGDHYEYEMNVLIELGKKKIPMEYVTIATIYENNNACSHFRPFLDSGRIYFNILKYSFSSILSALLDIILFTLGVRFLFGSQSIGIFFATVIARCFSGQFNFMMNKLWVFNSHAGYRNETFHYALLFFSQMILSWFFVSELVALVGNATLTKVLVDSTLFFSSYYIQRKIIFAHRPKERLI